MSPPKVSLKSLGLRAPDGLECPAGGQHHVEELELIIAAGRGGGSVICRKCNGPISLETTGEDLDD